MRQLHQSFIDTLVKWFFGNFSMFADSFSVLSIHCCPRIRCKLLPNTNCTQAVEFTPSSNGMVPSAAACSKRVTMCHAATDHSIAAGGDGSAQHVSCPQWPWPLTFDLDIQTCPSEGPNTSSSV